MPGKNTAQPDGSAEYVDVQPSDSIFHELGKNTYDYADLLSELIDNSIAARHVDRMLNVEVDIFVDEPGQARELVVRDDAKGIPPDLLGQAISPAALQATNSLNEHGLGMKQAIAAMGKLKYLTTKVDSEAEARTVTRFGYGRLPVTRSAFSLSSGTEVAVQDLNPIVVATQAHISRDLQPLLGSRYRRFLRPENKQVEITLRLRKTPTRDIIRQWSIEEVKPAYFHPSSRSNRPVINRFPLSGNGWAAHLTFGYAPDESEKEYEELGLDVPTKFHPYHVSQKNQGVDVILHDRVILFHQLSELGIIARHPDFNKVRGEIDLGSGFATAITKNSMINDAHFRECIDEIQSILTGIKPGPGGVKKNYLRVRTYPEQLPEKLLRDRLSKWLGTNPLQAREDVKTEYVVEGIEGYVDIIADGEAWELKVGQARALDVYQLFMYMDVAHIEKGFLVAPDFTTGARVARDHIAKTHKKDIKLSHLCDFPITAPPDERERSEYY